MKVTCEYCGAYVEADENMKCPLCCAELGSSVQAEQQRIQQQEEAEQQREAEEAAEEAKHNHISEIIQGISSVATAVVAGAAQSGKTQEEAHREDLPPIPPDGHAPHERQARPHVRDDSFRHADGPGGKPGRPDGDFHRAGGPGSGPGGMPNRKR